VTLQWRTIAEQIVRDTGLDFSVVRHVDSLCTPLHTLGAVDGSKPRSVACALVVFSAQQLGIDCDLAGVAKAASVARGTVQKHLRVLLGAGLGTPPTPGPRSSCSPEASLQSHVGSVLGSAQVLWRQVPAPIEPCRKRLVWRDQCEGVPLADVQLIENCLVKRERSPELESCRTAKRRAIVPSCDGGNPVSEANEAVGLYEKDVDGDDSLSYGAAVRAVQRRSWGSMHEQARCVMLAHCVCLFIGTGTLPLISIICYHVSTQLRSSCATILLPRTWQPHLCTCQSPAIEKNVPWLKDSSSHVTLAPPRELPVLDMDDL